MEGQIRFGDIVFDKSFLFVRKGRQELKLTRSERALLQIFTRNIRRVLTRDQLLDAVSGNGSDVADRSIDYLINRLRAKLGDSARTPALIATQYGEGYVWLAEPEHSAAPAAALLVIGPVFGLEQLESHQQARSFLRRLQNALDAQTGPDQTVRLDEAGNIVRSGPARARFSLDISFYCDNVGLHCAAVLREVVSRQILQILRLVLNADDLATGQPDIWTLAESLKSTMWKRRAFAQDVAATPQDEPLELRMHEAGLLLSRLSQSSLESQSWLERQSRLEPENWLAHQSWVEAGAQLARERKNNPDDPQTSLMWAMHLYARILQSYPNTPFTIESVAAISAEIETLVLDSFPALQDNPIYLLGAAKLLLFTGRGHIGLAAQLAERAFSSSAAFAASFSVLGQIQACMGDIDAALRLYGRGIELSEPDSEFRVYLMVLRLNAMLAAGDRPTLDAACAQLYAHKPGTRMALGLFYAAPGLLADDLRLLLDRFDASQAHRTISYVYYIAARLFQREDNRENILRGVVSHMISRFGPDVVPDQVWQAAPRLRGMVTR